MYIFIIAEQDNQTLNSVQPAQPLCCCCCSSSENWISQFVLLKKFCVLSWILFFSVKEKHKQRVDLCECVFWNHIHWKVQPSALYCSFHWLHFRFTRCYCFNFHHENLIKQFKRMGFVVVIGLFFEIEFWIMVETSRALVGSLLLSNCTNCRNSEKIIFIDWNIRSKYTNRNTVSIHIGYSDTTLSFQIHIVSESINLWIIKLLFVISMDV